MATDLEEVVRNLTPFYDVTGRTVLVIGAGGGQLVEFLRPARRVIAVDKDAAALRQLAARLQDSALAAKFALLECDVLDVREPAEVIYLEFCLHQMTDPGRVLDHARTLADDVLIADHAAGSPWLWYAAEDLQLEAAWQAAERRTIRKQQSVEAVQQFPDYAALEAKMVAQGPSSLERIGSFRGTHPITIPMPYRLALL